MKKKEKKMTIYEMFLQFTVLVKKRSIMFTYVKFHTVESSDIRKIIDMFLLKR